MIDCILTTFEIERSLSMKGCPYGNAVAEATFKIFKTEFVHPRNFKSLEQLRENQIVMCCGLTTFDATLPQAI